MDLLHKRYASPFSFLDGMIQTGRFSEFVDEFFMAVAKEKEESVNWDFFLHKVYGKSYADFKTEMETTKRNQQMSERTIETTLHESMQILHNFNPAQNGGEN